MTNKSSEISKLKEENLELMGRISMLEQEISFLKTHPVFLQGLKGEALLAKLVNGQLTAFSESYDVAVGENVKVEVKFSKLNTPVPGRNTKRWNWSKPLGWKDKGKDFDFLLLIGDKDYRFSDQYPEESPYVFFLIPKDCVKDALTSGKAIGANVQLTTNLRKALSPSSVAIKKYMVPLSAIDSILKGK